MHVEAAVSLTKAELALDPVEQFRAWFQDAQQAEEIGQADAMCLATLGEDGYPQARIVLLKGFDAEGFVFFTNLDSSKGRALRVHPKAVLNFHWEPLERQVTISGDVRRVRDAEADAYFESRARASQIGAWASEQSQPLGNRRELDKRVVQFTERFADGPVPRPPHWSGFRLKPRSVEFWQGGAHRLHDRHRYERVRDTNDWVITRLNP